ncbi:hypothetical protein CHS0354_041975 [Potamilus streckersoni]|uniref:Uncharacterized protein n=1 Tax=Potamilus streckersoni TaxID=2493646 RepID=A0AAE0TAL4_9BIVA|nr:hypothetical protein CHS0354_041975 [Potamilus streckersoni]
MAIGEEPRPSNRFMGERAGENVHHDIDTDALDPCANNETILSAIDLEVLRDDVAVHNILPLRYIPVNISGNIIEEEPTANELGRRLLRVQISSDSSILPSSLRLQNNSKRRGSPNLDLIGCLMETNLDGDTLLNIYIINQEDKCAYWLINLVPCPECLNLTNNLFQSPLHLAVLTNQPRLVRRLIVGGAIVDFRDHNGDTPLHIACRKGYVNIVEALLQPVMHIETLENDYDIPYQKIPQNLEILNSDGLTCLHVASQERNIDVILLLLSKGSNINAKEAKSGKTILHVAVESGNILFLNFVLQNPDIDIGAKMYNGTTAIDLARGLHFIPMTWLLREFGAQMSSESDTKHDYESLPDLSDEESEETNLKDACATFSKEMDKSSACGWTGVRTESYNIESMEIDKINTFDQNNQNMIRCSDFRFEQTRLDGHDNRSVEMDEHLQEASGIITQISSGRFEADFGITQDNNSDQNRFGCVNNRNISPNSSDNSNCCNIGNEIGKCKLDIHLGNSMLVESSQQVSLSAEACYCTFENSLLGSRQDVRYVKAEVKPDNKPCEKIKLSLNISNDLRFSNNGASDSECVRNLYQRQDRKSQNQTSLNTVGGMVFSMNEGFTEVESSGDFAQHAEIACSGNVNGELDSGDFNNAHCAYRSLDRRSRG